ncbi:MAG TPA: XRE family transcriptional regulator [Treponema sp.]|nr:XRE family transcriptional regulator [Treponema sp.]
MEFGEKLQQLRKNCGFTQEQLAEKIFVSRTAISKWESGRGYPSLDYLKSISKLFSTSIDELLSGKELIQIIGTDNQKKMKNLRELIFGIFDCLPALLLFLPFFAQRENDVVRHVSLLVLDIDSVYIRTVFISFIGLIFIFGIAELALQNFQHEIWLKYKTPVSLFLSIFAVVLFISSPLSYAYAAVFMFCLLVVKGILLIKRR